MNRLFRVLYCVPAILLVLHSSLALAGGPNSRAQFVIGIAGGTGVGKTTLATRLAEMIGEDAVVVHVDNYNRHSRVEREQLGIRNHDPRSIDYDQLKADLARLRAGHTVRTNLYDHRTGNILRGRLVIAPRPIVLIEGLHVLSALSPDLDLKVFVQASETLQVKRSLARDTRHRGYDEVSVRRKMQSRAPLFERFVLPQRREARLVIQASQVVRPITHARFFDSTTGRTSRRLVRERTDAGRAAAAWVYRHVPSRAGRPHRSLP